MDKFTEVKAMLDNRQVIERYLGNPNKHTSKGDWYISPFRNEKTASFYVSDKGIHDFGSSQHYDIISFIENYYKVTPLEALKVICRDFNINILDEKIDKKEIKKIKEERERQIRLKEETKKWYNKTMNKVIEDIKTNKKLIDYYSKGSNFEILEILYKEQAELEIQFETLFNITEKQKEEYFKKEVNYGE